MNRRKTKFVPRLTNWVSLLWKVMAATGNGYKRDSLRHTGRGIDRRADKLEFVGPQRMRRYRARYS